MWISLREMMIRGLQGLYDLLNYPQSDKEKKRLAEIRAEKKLARQKRDAAIADERREADERFHAREEELCRRQQDRQAENQSKLLDCPHCGCKCQRKAEAKNDASGCFLVNVGICLCPFLIGIPIVIYGLIHGSKRAYFWVCTKCLSKFPCD